MDAHRDPVDYKWKTTDGKAVLVDGAFWYSGLYYGDSCARLRKSKDFKLDDMSCDKLLTAV